MILMELNNDSMKTQASVSDVFNQQELHIFVTFHGAETRFREMINTTSSAEI